MSRALARLILLALLSGMAFGASAAPCAGFTDVDSASPFCDEVQWMKNRGVTLGCTATEYCPNADVTRLQMALFMFRLGDALFPSTCTSGQVMKWNGTAWACAADATAGGGGTVSSVTAGTGLTGGTITSSGTIAVDSGYVQRRVSASCAPGSSIRAIAADGTVTCETDDAGPANAFVQGGNAFNAVARLGTTDNQPLQVLVNGAPAIRIEPHAISPNVLHGYTINGLVYPGVYGTSIGGGGAPGTTYQGESCDFVFGCQNSATDHFGTIGGGAGNVAGDPDSDLTNGHFATIGGGRNNEARLYGTVGGGRSNLAAGAYATVGGGTFNFAQGVQSTVLGGTGNLADGTSSIAGGTQSKAMGQGSVAIGTFARANHAGTFVFADATPTLVSTGAVNQFVVRSLGGAYIYTSGTSDLNYQGAWLAPGTTAWQPLSDRDGKEAITVVDAEDVLRKVAAMPISTWQWKTEPGAVRHMGPMAQDFHAAFGLGTSDKRIVTVDADGVALAAIQGLNAKVEAERAAKNAEIAALRTELAAIRSLLASRQSP